MQQMSLAPSATSTARTSYASGALDASQTAVRRVSTEIDAIWQLTEKLATLVAHPVAALEHVTRTAGELTAAEAAAVLLHPGSELVLASRWGIVGVPLGYKSPDIRRTLDAAWAATATMPIRSGTHEVGCVWIARGGEPFSADEQRVLRTLASVTSLALPTLVDARKAASQPPPVTSTPVDAAIAERLLPPATAPIDDRRLVPEALRAAMLPSALRRLLLAIDQGADVDTIAAAIETDSVLSMLVLRASNCAAAGRARPTGRLREAIVFLGMQRLRTLALANFTHSLVNTAGALDVLLWELAIGTSVRTQQLVLALDADADGDAARLAGLLHPMGTIALAIAHRERYEHVLRTSIREDRAIDEVELTVFGTDAPTLTGQLVHAWHLESALPADLRGASDGGVSLRDALDWATHVSLAANPIWQRLVTDAGLGTEPRWVAGRIATAARALDLDDGRTTTIIAMSDAALDETRRLLTTMP